ncbi:MucR family transcriptional regulator [Sphingomonas sp. RB1R13]|uniref:MucR family transcriptional regulator n=1 Tax=Sphingomonas sp. RB1R13 TaxID=3096159 RepID=UPI002FC6454E
MADEETSTTPVELATELTIAWLGNPNTRATGDDVPAFLRAMYDAVRGLDSSVQPGAPEEPTADYTPATTARRSLSSADHIISMIDGKPYKTLRRHLSTHGLTPAQYRERYKLKPDYPMVAPSYSEVRRSMAKKIGLGQKGRPSRTLPATEVAPVKAATRRGRKAKSPNAD